MINGKPLSFVQIEMSAKVLSDWVQYLECHEDDIAYGINDFGDLWIVFVSLIGREPMKDPVDS